MSLSDKLAAVESLPALPDAPTDPVQIVARAAGVTLLQAAKVLTSLYALDPTFVLAPLPIVGEELAKAIRDKTAYLTHYMHLAEAASAREPVKVAAALLLPESRAAEMCNGCPESLECVLHSLSTPQACRTGRHAVVTTRVVRATRTAVRLHADHPVGFYDVPLKYLSQMMEQPDDA